MTVCYPDIFIPFIQVGTVNLLYILYVPIVGDYSHLSIIQKLKTKTSINIILIYHFKIETIKNIILFF